MRVLTWLLCAVAVCGCTNHCVVLWQGGPYHGTMTAFPTCRAFEGAYGLPNLCSLDGAPFQPCDLIDKK